MKTYSKFITIVSSLGELYFSRSLSQASTKMIQRKSFPRCAEFSGLPGDPDSQMPERTRASRGRSQASPPWNRLIGLDDVPLIVLGSTTRQHRTTETKLADQIIPYRKPVPRNRPTTPTDNPFGVPWDQWDVSGTFLGRAFLRRACNSSTDPQSTKQILPMSNAKTLPSGVRVRCAWYKRPQG